MQIKGLLKSKELEDKLKKLIMKKMKPGDQVLPERALAEKFHVGRITAKTAVDNLTKAGFLERIKGKGTFVTNRVNSSCKINFVCMDFPFGSFDKISEEIKDKAEIQLEIQYSSGDFKVEEDTEMLIQFARSGKYDLISVNEGNIPTLAERGLIQPIDEFLENSNKLSRSDFFPSLLKNYFTYKNKLYGIPLCWASPVLIYNKKLFKRYNLDFPDETWTWKDLKKACGIFNMPSPDKPVIVPLCLDMLNLSFLTTVLWQNNAKMFDEDNNCLSDSKNFIDAIAYFHSLIADYGAKPYIVGTQFQTSAIFELDRLAMVATLSSVVQLVAGNKRKEEWGVAPLPSNKNNTSKLPVQGLAMPVHSKADGVFNAIEEICRKQRVKEISRIAQRLSALSSCTNEIPEFCLKALDATPLNKGGVDRHLYLLALKKELTLVWNDLETPENVCRNIKLILDDIKIRGK
jgi:multiple sugar transport system substrate-binding protein